MSEVLQTYLGGEVEAVEKRLLGLPQVEIPLTHHFAPGVYMREAKMPAGALVIGHKHVRECINIVLTGAILVKIDGVIQTLRAPFIFKSAAGVRKMAYVIEETRWINIHATTETDLAVIEAEQIDKSDTFKDYEKQLQEMTDKISSNAIIDAPRCTSEVVK